MFVPWLLLIKEGSLVFLCKTALIYGFNRTKSNRLLLFALFFDMLHQSFYKFFHFLTHYLIASAGDNSFGKSRDGFNKKHLHFVDLHIFCPQVDTHRVFLPGIPDRQSYGFGTFFFAGGVVRRFPLYSFRYILLVQLYCKFDFGLSHVCYSLFKVESL